ncbi:MAG: hypothetical protein K9J17_11060 [Flavobacteriales bacterium]|nr:hypothetical protein [Flavobacteriales bacterium]
MENQEYRRRLKTIRIWLGLFMVGLALSGITAFPLETELNWLADSFDDPNTTMAMWIDSCRDAIVYVNAEYPFLSYGTDWLAFAHLVLALVFVGPWMDPVKNIWVIRFGIITCLAVFPLAFIAGSIRGIPLYWQLIDCSFGVFGSIPLFIALHHTKLLESK